MIKTFYGVEQLVTAPTAGTFLAALVIGLFFGFALEQAGFGSSRKLAGIFYFRDMTVLRVMFTAMITAMLGLLLLAALGWIDVKSQIYVVPTLYGAQAVGGLIFGVGFAMSGWCPGTGAVGMAAGRLDALVFLVGVVLGAIAFNETYGWTTGLLTEAKVQVAFGLPTHVFAFAFTLMAVLAFYGAEWVERAMGGGGRFLNSSFLRGFSVCLVIAAVAVVILPSDDLSTRSPSTVADSEQNLLASVEAAEDHIEPEMLADLLMAGDADLVLVDVRPADEYRAYHVPGAVNVALDGLIDYLTPQKNRARIVLYSNGMTHPAQARDALARLGFRNVSILTDGVGGFLERCLMPVSLRPSPLPPDQIAQVAAWRQFFTPEPETAPAVAQVEADVPPPVVSENDAPRLVSTTWLSEQLGTPNLRIIDCRTHADYTRGHIPGSVYLNFESIRGCVGGVPSVLLPSDLLARHLSLLGVKPTDMVVLDPGDGLRDATLISMALQRVGHPRWGILHGGFPKWSAERRPVETTIPVIESTDYPAAAQGDEFTVDYRYLRDHLGDPSVVMVDTRPGEFFTGEKSSEARPGHIPGAVNRVFKQELDGAGNLKPVAELEVEYGKLVPTKETTVVVYCRTGHQASLTFFVLKEVLGYPHVKWYDGSWSDWAARPELPVESGVTPAAGAAGG